MLFYLWLFTKSILNIVNKREKEENIHPNEFLPNLDERTRNQGNIKKLNSLPKNRLGSTFINATENYDLHTISGETHIVQTHKETKTVRNYKLLFQFFQIYLLLN